MSVCNRRRWRQSQAPTRLRRSGLLRRWRWLGRG